MLLSESSVVEKVGESKVGLLARSSKYIHFDTQRAKTWEQLTA